MSSKTVKSSPSIVDKNSPNSIGPALPGELKKIENVIRVAPITTFGEWVVILPFYLDTNIILPDSTDYRNVGVVVGKSNSIMAPNGNYVDSRLDYGMVVLFQKSSVVADMFINREPYEGRRLLLLSERNVVLRLPAVPVEILDAKIGFEDFGDFQIQK